MSTPRLLIVDDDRNTREGYQLYLSAKGFHVLDLGLPDIDGWEVARRLKGDEATRNIPIIAFSGRSMQHEQVSALRAGCDMYLTKPCAPDRLLGAIHKLLGLEHGPAAATKDQPDPY